MKFKTGEMFDHVVECDVLLVTGNATRRADNNLVMGRGAAADMKHRFQGIDAALGGKIYEHELKHGSRPYGLLMVNWPFPKMRLGVFQVKYFFKDDARPDLILFSMRKLSDWMRKHPKETVYMNFPGIGAGGLSEEVVMPIISRFNCPKLTLWRK